MSKSHEQFIGDTNTEYLMSRITELETKLAAENNLDWGDKAYTVLMIAKHAAIEMADYQTAATLLAMSKELKPKVTYTQDPPKDKEPKDKEPKDKEPKDKEPKDKEHNDEQRTP